MIIVLVRSARTTQLGQDPGPGPKCDCQVLVHLCHSEDVNISTGSDTR